VDIFQVATNMGCSANILRQHYAHLIPEQFAPNLAGLIFTAKFYDAITSIRESAFFFSAFVLARQEQCYFFLG
jgi:hypothetical protein